MAQDTVSVTWIFSFTWHLAKFILYPENETNIDNTKIVALMGNVSANTQLQKSEKDEN